MTAGVSWTIVKGDGPLVACAIHAGNQVRAEALRHMAIRRGQRFGEEDPFTNRLMADFQSVEVAGRSLDVRENVRFRGGHLSRWVHSAFPGQACCLAVEVKKFFMDERTGVIDEPVWTGVQEALTATIPGVLDELDRLRAVRRLRRRASVVA